MSTQVNSSPFTPAMLQAKKDDVMVVTGIVKKLLRGAMFEVELNDQFVPNKKNPRDAIIIATICGKMKKNLINVVLGDAVVVWLPLDDLTKGRIMYRGSTSRKPVEEASTK